MKKRRRFSMCVARSLAGTARELVRFPINKPHFETTGALAAHGKGDCLSGFMYETFGVERMPRLLCCAAGRAAAKAPHVQQDRNRKRSTRGNKDGRSRDRSRIKPKLCSFGALRTAPPVPEKRALASGALGEFVRAGALKSLTACQARNRLSDELILMCGPCLSAETLPDGMRVAAESSRAE